MFARQLYNLANKYDLPPVLTFLKYLSFVDDTGKTSLIAFELSCLKSK